MDQMSLIAQRWAARVEVRAARTVAATIAAAIVAALALAATAGATVAISSTALNGTTSVVIWMDFAGHGRTAVRPATVRFPMFARAVHVRWTRFGARTAVGFGTLKLDGLPGRPCNASWCLGHDSRVKVVASRPSRCPDLGEARYYGNVAIVTTTRVGVLEPGSTLVAREPVCLTGRPMPASTRVSRSEVTS
jgi:hypothetical protein